MLAREVAQPAGLGEAHMGIAPDNEQFPALIKPAVLLIALGGSASRSYHGMVRVEGDDAAIDSILNPPVAAGDISKGN